MKIAIILLVLFLFVLLLFPGCVNPKQKLKDANMSDFAYYLPQSLGESISSAITESINDNNSVESTDYNYDSKEKVESINQTPVPMDSVEESS